MKRGIAQFALAATLLGMALAANATPVNLVTNGGFETNDFTGWTSGGDTTNNFVTNTSPAPIPASDPFFAGDQYEAYLGPIGSDGTLSQSLTTQVGQSYTVSFYLESAPDLINTSLDPTPNDFSASFGNTNLLALTDAPAFSYVHYTFTETATSDTTQLLFSFRQDPDYWALTGVSVYANNSNNPPPVPELGSSVGLLSLLGLGCLPLAFRKRARNSASTL